jgi:hypothetical protein
MQQGKKQFHRRQMVCRYFIALHFVCFICELGVVSITLINLYNDVAITSISTEDTRRAGTSQIGITIASLAITLVTFGLTVLDTGGMLSKGRDCLMQAVQRVFGLSAMRTSHVHPGGQLSEGGSWKQPAGTVIEKQ